MIEATADVSELAKLRTQVAVVGESVERRVLGWADDLKRRWRSAIAAGGLGTRLGRTIRSRVEREGDRVIGVVWSRAPRVIGPHVTGAVIRGRSGWLSIPTPAAPLSVRGGRITPGQFEARTGERLGFVYRPGRPGLLVARGRISSRGRWARGGRGRTIVPLFVLVPQVTLRRRIDLATPTREALARLNADLQRRGGR